ncbi:hypothetical protein NQ317_010292 [Molorchus minor]|uniref:Uncharacterized protein n=1 Tax=Molorchus minor TaxID=1323400 RepID=A0ABQ9JLE9_9CUCU|nr:hypothetical protein NQ317_010292 [Molorchus minor]
MNSLIKSARLSNSWLKTNAIAVSSVRNHWNKDYKPGPYPKTEAERAAAAEKYGLPLKKNTSLIQMMDKVVGITQIYL